MLNSTSTQRATSHSIFKFNQRNLCAADEKLKPQFVMQIRILKSIRKNVSEKQQRPNGLGCEREVLEIKTKIKFMSTSPVSRALHDVTLFHVLLMSLTVRGVLTLITKQACLGVRNESCCGDLWLDSQTMSQ